MQTNKRRYTVQVLDEKLTEEKQARTERGIVLSPTCPFSSVMGMLQ